MSVNLKSFSFHEICVLSVGCNIDLHAESSVVLAQADYAFSNIKKSSGSFLSYIENDKVRCINKLASKIDGGGTLAVDSEIMLKEASVFDDSKGGAVRVKGKQSIEDMRLIALWNRRAALTE